uniref:Uncharacterized protein n=1 Tax=Tetraselmis sp. GSL018 TaxID=582737 RepID=A0A061RXV3_9CHLO
MPRFFLHGYIFPLFFDSSSIFCRIT